MLKYNIFLELAVIPLDIILCVFFSLRYTEDTRVNREFKLLAFLVLFGTIADVVAGVVLSMGASIPVFPRYLTNTLNYFLATFGAYQFVRYVISYVGEKHSGSTGVFINKVLLGIYLIIMAQNAFTGTVFSYLKNGQGVNGPLFTLVVYAFPLYYILYGGLFILSHGESYAKNLKHALAITFVFMLLLYGVQMFFARDLLVTFFAASLAVLVMFLTLETPDYVKLKRTLEELSVSKRELEASNIRATEASHAKTRFLAQMSNDIRTPVNAIMGYSNLILADTNEEATKEYSKRVKISAKRLLTFFENVLNYVSEEVDENVPRRLPSMKELIDNTDESEFDDSEDSGPEAAIAGASKMRILVVDDTPLNIDLMLRMLKPMGFQVDTASNGQQAILQVRKSQYDLIFMDHLMPVMDGVTALTRLREEKLCDDTPVIMLTANAIAGEEEKYLQSGFSAYLSKPFTEDDVTEILKKHLPEKRSMQGEMAGIEAWEELQEQISVLRVADAREYLLHDIKLYKKILIAYANEEIRGALSDAVRSSDYAACMAIIRSEGDKARLIGDRNLSNKADKMEFLCKKKEFELLRERIGTFIEERSTLSEIILRQLQGDISE